MSITTKLPNLLQSLNNDNLVAWMNNPNTEVTMRIVQMSHNYRERSAIVELTLFTSTPEKDYRSTYLVNCKMTKKVFNWFHSTNAKDDDGNWTKTRLASYQKYLQSRELPINTKIQDMEFSCANADEDYKLNPFRLKINKEYGTATLYNVQEPNYYRNVKFNPSDPENPIVSVLQAKDPKTGYVRNRSKINYRRLEVS